jgi:hypothetical protein
MGGSMNGPRAKIERAKKHIHELETAVGGLVFSKSTHPDVIVTEDDTETENVFTRSRTSRACRMKSRLLLATPSTTCGRLSTSSCPN